MTDYVGVQSIVLNFKGDDVVLKFLNLRCISALYYPSIPRTVVQERLICTVVCIDTSSENLTTFHKVFPLVVQVREHVPVPSHNKFHKSESLSLSPLAGHHVAD